MTKRARTILFLTFLFLFLLITPVAIFYSQGYRINLNPPAGGKKLTRTGGLFVKVEPRQIEIYIDEKLAKKTDFFFGSALVENLLPKKYKIRIEKEGYHPWEKKLEVKEKEVIEVKNVVLFPKNLGFEILTKEVENYWFSSDDKKIILKERRDEDWALKLYDLDENLKSHLISGKEIYPQGADFLDLKLAEDSGEIYLDIAMNEQEKHYTLRLDKSPSQLAERRIAEIPENIVTFQKINNDFYYLDNSGYVFKNEVKLNEKLFAVQPETEYSLEMFQNFVFLRDGQNLYLLNSDSKSFEKFFEGIRNLKISPDNKKLVYFSNSEVWILFLKDMPTKKAGEKLFINRLSEKIGDVFWLNPDYLIFNSGNKIKITEIDERDKINIIDLAEFKGARPKDEKVGAGRSPEIFWNRTDKKLYLLSEGNLFASERLY